MRCLIALFSLLSLAGCGLADTATSAAVGGVSKVQEIEQARRTQERALQGVDTALQQGVSRLEKAEAASQ